MGLTRAAIDAVTGTLADQWGDFYTAPVFDEQTFVARAVLQERNRGRGLFRRGSKDVLTDGTRIAVPENTALIITDGGRIISFSSEPGYFVFENDGQPSIFTGSHVRESLVEQAWERFKFGGTPAQQQHIYFINLREIRSIRFGTPGPLPYKDHSLARIGSTHAPVLRLRARGQYSVRIVNPIRFFFDFLPANVHEYSITDEAARAQLNQEFISAFQAALQSLSRTTDIATLATHSTQLAAALSSTEGPGGSWLVRFGLEIVSVAVSTIEYDEESRLLMDKYNTGAMLGGEIGAAYAQSTAIDSLADMAEARHHGDSIADLDRGVNTVADTAFPSPANDPAAALRQLKSLLDQGLITQEQYAAKQQEVIDRM